MKEFRPFLLICILTFVAACSTQDDSNQALEVLQEKVAELESRLLVQEDIEQIRALQYAYNYYNSSRLYRQVLDLISDNAGSIEIAGRGVFNGKEGFALNFNPDANGQVSDSGVEFGFVLHQLAGMEVITVAPDHNSARARVRVATSVYADFPETQPRYNGGDYEMQFVKEESKWLISGLKYVHNYSVGLEADGTVTPRYSRPGDPNADAPTTWYHPWPETGVLSFHFPNPVTGEFPPDVTGSTRYWRGNWGDNEFGSSGVRPAAEWQTQN